MFISVDEWTFFFSRARPIIDLVSDVANIYEGVANGDSAHESKMELSKLLILFFRRSNIIIRSYCLGF